MKQPATITKEHATAAIFFLRGAEISFRERHDEAHARKMIGVIEALLELIVAARPDVAGAAAAAAEAARRAREHEIVAVLDDDDSEIVH